MQPLEHLQREFIAVLQTEASEAAIGFGASHLSPQQSLALYRRNYREHHIEALRQTYECVVTMVGDAYFRQLARRFVPQIPSTSGDLNDYGGEFAEFLEAALKSAPGGENLHYLPDLARVDWATQQALLNGSGVAPTLQALPQFSSQQQAQCRLVLSPNCTVVRSQHPLYNLWQLATGKKNQADVTAQGQSIIVSRPNRDVDVRLLDEAAVNLIEHWQHHSLSHALERFQTQHNAAQLADVFTQLQTIATAFELRITP